MTTQRTGPKISSVYAFMLGSMPTVKLYWEINSGGNCSPVMIVGPTKLPSGYSGTVTFKQYFEMLQIQDGSP